MDPIDLQRLSLAGKVRATSVQSQKPPRHGAGQKFLKGPIPWSWLTKAAQLPGHALHIGVAIWFLAGPQVKRTISLSGTVLSDLGISRYAAYRAMRALERAALITVDRHSGRSPVITILETGTDNGPDYYDSVTHAEG
jgi:hypothetical protein